MPRPDTCTCHPGQSINDTYYDAYRRLGGLGSRENFDIAVQALEKHMVDEAIFGEGETTYRGHREYWRRYLRASPFKPRESSRVFRAVDSIHAVT